MISEKQEGFKSEIKSTTRVPLCEGPIRLEGKATMMMGSFLLLVLVTFCCGASMLVSVQEQRTLVTSLKAIFDKYTRTEPHQNMTKLGSNTIALLQIDPSKYRFVCTSIHSTSFGGTRGHLAAIQTRLPFMIRHPTDLPSKCSYPPRLQSKYFRQPTTTSGSSTGMAFSSVKQTPKNPSSLIFRIFFHMSLIIINKE